MVGEIVIGLSVLRLVLFGFKKLIYSTINQTGNRKSAGSIVIVADRIYSSYAFLLTIVILVLPIRITSAI